MTDAEKIAIVVRFSAGFLVLVWLYRSVYCSTQREIFRQRIFEIRRSMFLLVADGRIAPTDPAYTMLRSTANGLLSFAEGISLTRLLLVPLVAGSRGMGKAYVERLDRALGAVEDEKVREELRSASIDMSIAVAHLVLTTSPILTPLYGLAFLVHEAFRAFGLNSSSPDEKLSRDANVKSLEAEAMFEAEAQMIPA